MLTFIRRSHCLVCVFLSACLSNAANAQNDGAGWITAPLVALIANAEKTEVRAIQGVPGSSTVGDPIILPQGIGRVYLAPGQRWALVEPSGGGKLGRMSWNGINPSGVVPIDAAISAPDLVSFSPKGQSAALLSRADGTVQIVSHLEGVPQIGFKSGISDLDVVSIAVSDDSTLAAMLTATGEVYLLPAGGSRQLLLSTRSPAALAFLPGQSALAIADGGNAVATVLDGLGNQPFTRISVSVPQLTGDAALVQATSDGRSLIVAELGGRTAYRIDLVSQNAQSLDLPTAISRLERLSGDTFLLSANPGEAAWMLLAQDGVLRAGFAQFTGRFRLSGPPTSHGARPDLIGSDRH